MKKFTIRNYEFFEVQKERDDYNNIEAVFEGENIEVSDEYHTMHELYQHRMALNILLFKMMFKLDEQVRGKEAYSNPLIMKSMLHYDGTMFPGYFIVFANTAVGQISYHYKVEHWNKFDIPIVPQINVPFDGHGSKEVMERLMKL